MKLTEVKEGQVVEYEHLKKRIKGRVVTIDDLPHFPIEVTIGTELNAPLRKRVAPEDLTLIKETI